MTKEILLRKLRSAKLKKIKSKMITEALETGTSERGNHKVECIVSDEHILFIVFYRGTIIAEIKWLDNTVAYLPIGAGEFENTPATIRQRKEIQEAIAELQIATKGIYEAVS